MAFPLTEYVKIKNRYCLGYFGHDEACVRQMLAARPGIERKHPGIEVYLCFRDELCYLCGSEPRCLKMSDLESLRDQLAHVKELKGGLDGGLVSQAIREFEAE